MEFLQASTLNIMNVVAGVAIVLAGAYLRNVLARAGKDCRAGIALMIWGVVWAVTGALGLLIQYFTMAAVTTHDIVTLKLLALVSLAVKSVFIASSIVFPWLVVRWVSPE